MSVAPKYGLAKSERLHGSAVDGLFVRNKGGYAHPYRYIYKVRAASAEDEASVSVLFVVPKRNVKRAVGRNLLKRRTREAYRTQKLPLCTLATQKGVHIDVGLIYNTKEIVEYRTLSDAVRTILEKIAGRL